VRGPFTSVRWWWAFAIPAPLISGACRDAAGRTGETDIAVGMDAADTALPEPVDTSDGDDTDASLDLDITVQTCTPRERRCLDGMQAECEADGLGYAFTPCPVGEVCEGAACVPNVPRVTIVMNAPSFAAPGAPPFLPAALWDDASQEACDLTAECCDVGPLEGGYTLSVVAKYWVRRLVRDLKGVADVVVIAPPTHSEASLPPELCGPASLDVQNRACIRGDNFLMTLNEWDDLEAAMHPDGPPQRATGLPVPSGDEAGAEAVRVLLGRVSRVDETAEPSMEA